MNERHLFRSVDQMREEDKRNQRVRLFDEVHWGSTRQGQLLSKEILYHWRDFISTYVRCRRIMGEQQLQTLFWPNSHILVSQSQFWRRKGQFDNLVVRRKQALWQSVFGEKPGFDDLVGIKLKRSAMQFAQKTSLPGGVESR